MRYLENYGYAERARESRMTSAASPQPCHLREDDIPGAALNGRKPEQLKIPELKLWLACRGAPTKGKKADLIERQVMMLF